MTNFHEPSSIFDPTYAWCDSIAKEIDRRIVERLFRKKIFRNPKRYHSCFKHYLSKTLHKK